MDYANWLKNLNAGETCTIAFLDSENPRQFLLKAGTVEGESKSSEYWKVRFFNNLDSIPVWIEKKMGYGLFLEQPIFIVPPTTEEATTVNELGYPLEHLEYILKRHSETIDSGDE